MRGATKPPVSLSSVTVISIHAPRAGCDWGSCPHLRRGLNFNPRTPCGVRHEPEAYGAPKMEISIHAPRAGCDADQDVYIEPALAFQSTHPVRGATLYPCRAELCTNNFNPRTPCGVRRHTRGGETRPIFFISIHAPRAGCDSMTQCERIVRHLFQSTHPVRGATHDRLTEAEKHLISIHAPRAGCDYSNAYGCGHYYGISIHAPRAGCDNRDQPRLVAVNVFQSTHPVRGATLFPLLVLSWF